MRPDGYERNVFINCPFDDDYAPLFEAIVFAINDAGFRPKCARERLDSSQIRLQKIIELISMSRYSIHDLSRTALDTTNALPRFNMPLELGIDIGCKAFNSGCANKSFLIFDTEQYRFQKFVSDLSGQDIHQHGNSAKAAVARVRDWLRTESGRSDIPGGATIYAHYEKFRRDLPSICSELKLDLPHLTFADFSYTIARWLRRTREPRSATRR
jgi:hypothetical protein